ncbi:MAG TPA: PqqD family protein [Candidatus Acidoferrum sp.]|nr:PqqD family protein [Candidatus Acidoferrum sp.]
MLNMRVELSPQALSQEIGGEVVILDLASTTYFGLDKVGARFWQLLQDNPEVEPACKQLLTEYEVSAEQLELDLRQLLTQLSEAGLLKLV